MLKLSISPKPNALNGPEGLSSQEEENSIESNFIEFYEIIE
jgi:hypothetical protein